MCSAALGAFWERLLTWKNEETLRWNNRALRWRFNDSEEWERANIYQMVMANGKYFGGGMLVAPEAELNSGVFDVMIFRDVGITDVALLPRVYMGTHVDDERVRPRTPNATF